MIKCPKCGSETLERWGTLYMTCRNPSCRSIGWTDNVSAMSVIGTLESKLESAQSRIAVLESTLKKIDAIRNDIVGRQTVGWSRHIYPLVAALEESGFEGIGYEKAKEAAVTMDQENAELREKVKRATALLEESKILLARACLQTDNWLTKDIDNYAGKFAALLTGKVGKNE
jgi:hypothetical protein